MFDTNLGWVGRRWENVETEIRSVRLNPMLWYLVLLLPCLIDRQFSISHPLKRKIERKGIFQEVLPSYLFFIKQTSLFCSSLFFFFVFSFLLILLLSPSVCVAVLYVIKACRRDTLIKTIALRGWFYTIKFKNLRLSAQKRSVNCGQNFTCSSLINCLNEWKSISAAWDINSYFHKLVSPIKTDFNICALLLIYQAWQDYLKSSKHNLRCDFILNIKAK